MAAFSPKTYERRYERRTGKSGLLEKGILEYQAQNGNDTVEPKVNGANPNLTLGSTLVERPSDSELRRILRGSNTRRLNIILQKKLKRELFLPPAQREVLHWQDEEKALMAKRTALSMLVGYEGRTIIMLMLQTKPKTIVELAKEFEEVTTRAKKSQNVDRALSRIMENTLVPHGFVKKIKDGVWTSYSLGPKGIAYGQALAFLSLKTEKETGISMFSIFGSVGSTNNESNGPLHRFLILQRLSKGDARINEIWELIGANSKRGLKLHVDALKDAGLVEYFVSKDDLELLGSLGDLPAKFAKNGAEGLTFKEFGRLRIRMTANGKAMSELLLEMENAAHNKPVDASLVKIASIYSNDPIKIKTLATPAMIRYLSFTKTEHGTPYLSNGTIYSFPNTPHNLGSQLRA